nr:FAD-dependent oxidoreductase [Rhodoferax sp.]
MCADAGDLHAKPSLSNALAQKRPPEQLVTTPAAKMAQSLNLTPLPNTTVQGIDLATKTVALRQGALRYDQLVLATGAQAIRIPLGGDAADHVLSVNALAHFTKFHAGLACADAGGCHVAIMGAGLIGCEFANDLVAVGHRVSVIDPSTDPLSALLPAEASMQLQDALSHRGVTWHWGATVLAVHSATSTADTEQTPPAWHCGGPVAAGQRTALVFPTMPVRVKTPALPIVVVPARPGTPGIPGAWCKVEDISWERRAQYAVLC